MMLQVFNTSADGGSIVLPCDSQDTQRPLPYLSGHVERRPEYSCIQIGRDQNEDGARGISTGDMRELMKKKCQNPTRRAERIHVHYSIVLTGSVQRPS